MEELIIIWAVVIAVALLLEFITYEFVSTWFAVGGIASLILAACEVDLEIQIIVFVSASLFMLLCFRPIVKRLTKVEMIPTNADSNIGKVFKLEAPVTEGKSQIKINGVMWTVVCNKPLGVGAKVIVTEIAGNKFIVKKAENVNTENKKSGGK